jgi:hypothetical protein
MDTAKTDQLQAQITDDLTDLIDIAYSAAVYRSEGDHDTEQELMEAYAIALATLPRERLIFILDRALNMVAAQYAIEEGREDLLLEPPVSLDDMPPLD